MKSDNYIRYWREIKGWTQEELARNAGRSLNAIARLENGSRKGNLDTFSVISKALGITVDHLIHGPSLNNEISNAIYVGPVEGTETIPLLANIPAGPWRDWFDDFPVGEGMERLPRYGLKGEHIFAIRVDGDSMEPRLHQGDLLILNPELAFNPSHVGRIGVVKFNGNYKIRTVHLSHDGNNYLLSPENQAYPPESVPVTGTTVFKIVDVRPFLDGEKY